MKNRDRSGNRPVFSPPYVWRPGEGCDVFALARMREHFGRPRRPMGEAWFMGEARQLYPELMGDLDGLSVEHLRRPFEEIASGSGSFGFRAEWRDWYHYLLAALLPRANEEWLDTLLEYFVLGFIAQYPHGIDDEPYQGFRNDALDTLGRCLMDAACWRDDDIVIGSILHRSNANPANIWRWWDASGDFSAALVFCLKYLPVARVGPWFRSVLAIPSPHWRAQLIVWLVGARDLLEARIHWPADFSEASPRIGWAWSHCLGPTLGRGAGDPLAGSSLIPDANRRVLLEMLHADMTAAVYDEWLVSIMEVDYLIAELGTMPDEFLRLYVEHRQRG